MPSLLDHFAEHLANDPAGDVARAAGKLGKSKSWGQQMLRRIRAGLGEQAR